jgi:hypothetical protein
MDIVQKMRGFEADHKPEGWPAVQMKQISALCDEIDRLREELTPSWSESGLPTTIAAAAEDADQWLQLIEKLHGNGRGPWLFSEVDSLGKLKGCRRELRRFLQQNTEAEQPARAKEPR